MSEETTELVLQPPSGKKLSLRAMSDFYDLTGINFRHYGALVTCQQNLDRARAGEIVPHGKSVEQLEEELLGLSQGINEWKANAVLIYLRYRDTNPGLTLDQVLDMDLDDFMRVVAPIKKEAAELSDDAAPLAPATT